MSTDRSIHTEAPTASRRDNLTETGQNRFDAVMQAARRILVSDGYANLTMRRVAAEAGISIGHLQHFLPTKESVFEALWEYYSREYDDQYEVVTGNLPVDPVQRFVAVIDFLVRDIMEGATKTFYIELWSMSRHYAGARRVMDRMYDHHKLMIANFIGDINPTLPASQRDIRALQVVALIDGLTLHLDETLAEPGRYVPVREIIDTTLSIATAPTVTYPGATG